MATIVEARYPCSPEGPARPCPSIQASFRSLSAWFDIDACPDPDRPQPLSAWCRDIGFRARAAGEIGYVRDAADGIQRPAS